jgi:hypothetical protein
VAAKTMAFVHAEGVLLAVHPSCAPGDDDWEAYVQFCKGLPLDCKKTLVLTRGGGPNAKQRQHLNKEFLQNVEMQVAVVTDDSIVRGIVIALSWFNPLIRSFAAHEVNRNVGVWDAIHYLGISRTAGQRIFRQLEEMQASLGGGS